MSFTYLVRTVEDLKNHLAIDFIEGFDVLKFAVEDRENEIKDTYLGTALFDLLVQQRGGVMNREHLAKALFYTQRVICNYALLDYIPEGQLDISENGIRITVNETKKQAFDWQIKNLEAKYLATASRNLESLMKYLNENIDKFPEWTSSPVYLTLKRNMVNTVTQFNEVASKKINYLLFLELAPVITYVEDFYIRSIVGDEFFEELLERVRDGEDVDGAATTSTSSSSVSSSTATGSDSGSSTVPPPPPPDSPSDGNVNIITSDPETALHYDRIFRLIKGAVTQYTSFEAAEAIGVDPEVCEKKASHYVQRLVEYLNHNASSTLFANYFTSEKYTAPIDSTAYTSGGGIDNSEFTGVFGAF